MDKEPCVFQPLAKVHNYKPIRRDRKACKSVRWAPGTNFNTSGYAVPLRRKVRLPAEEVLRRQDAMKDAVVTLQRVCGQDFHHFVIESANDKVEFMRPSISVPDSQEALQAPQAYQAPKETIPKFGDQLPAAVDKPLVRPLARPLAKPLAKPPAKPPATPPAMSLECDPIDEPPLQDLNEVAGLISQQILHL
jgi:hypothetical protein